MLQYVVGTGDEARRVSVLVYDAQKIDVGTAMSASNFAPRAVGTAEVQVGRAKGYSVAAAQREGVGYLWPATWIRTRARSSWRWSTTIAERRRARRPRALRL